MINRVHKYYRNRYVLKQPGGKKAWKELENAEYSYCGDAIIEAQNISEFSGKLIIVVDSRNGKSVADYFQGKLLKKS